MPTIEKVEETPEAELKLRERQKLLSMFEEDDLDIKTNTPSQLNKTPKTAKSTSKTKASFNKIFTKVSGQSLNNTGDTNPSGAS